MKKQDWQIDNILDISRILSIHYKSLTHRQREKIRIKLWIYQDGHCAICNIKIQVSKGCLDHSHTTGLIRGLLCSNCNTGLGSFKDNKLNLRAAIRYVTNSLRLDETIEHYYEYTNEL